MFQIVCIRLTGKNGNEGRTVDNHFGKPLSSYNKSAWSGSGFPLSSLATSLRILAIRSLMSLDLILANRSRTASVTAVVMLSPVSAVNSCTRRCVSSFLIFRLMVEFYHSCLAFYQADKGLLPKMQFPPPILQMPY